MYTKPLQVSFPQTDAHELQGNKLMAMSCFFFFYDGMKKMSVIFRAQGPHLVYAHSSASGSWECENHTKRNKKKQEHLHNALHSTHTSKWRTTSNASWCTTQKWSRNKRANTLRTCLLPLYLGPLCALSRYLPLYGRQWDKMRAHGLHCGIIHQSQQHNTEGDASQRCFILLKTILY